MTLHPECQVQAQEEIDAVIGSERLPTFEDRSSLPYVESLLQESLRYVFHFPASSNDMAHVIPQLELCRSTGSVKFVILQRQMVRLIIIGVPHSSMEDDVYNGMFIPKDSIIIANTRYEGKSLCHSSPTTLISDVQSHDSGRARLF